MRAGPPTNGTQGSIYSRVHREAYSRVYQGGIQQGVPGRHIPGCIGLSGAFLTLNPLYKALGSLS